MRDTPRYALLNSSPRTPPPEPPPPTTLPWRHILAFEVAAAFFAALTSGITGYASVLYTVEYGVSPFYLAVCSLATNAAGAYGQLAFGYLSDKARNR
jgi:MFS family permease